MSDRSSFGSRGVDGEMLKNSQQTLIFRRDDGAKNGTAQFLRLSQNQRIAMRCIND
jgi:hypothetical protein